MNALKSSLRLAPIASSAARRLLDAHHPLGAGLPAPVNVGVFWCGRLEGVIVFGAPVVNVAVQQYGLRTREALELLKMWLSDAPPRNAESRALSVAVRLIARQYPDVRLLLTYCDSEETAAAYKATGWIPQDAHRYARNIKSMGQWLSIRTVNRRGGLKRLPPGYEVAYVSRRKWVYPLDPALAKTITPVALPASAHDGHAVDAP